MQQNNNRYASSSVLTTIYGLIIKKRIRQKSSTSEVIDGSPYFVTIANDKPHNCMNIFSPPPLPNSYTTNKMSSRK